MEVRPLAGERYVVQSPFRANVLVQWFAPLTSGSERILPKGLEFVVAVDPPGHATAVAADVVDRAEWEPLLVADEDRTADKYAGYYLVIDFNDLRLNCVQLNE